ncbi:hypothetical protein PUN28_008557 [Cardiocondyla obscurior]|uniref:Uncharacterized protein n=1 Tax=Cardiocondyla obscurior TaxID=286306 RepID=A0AAW2FYS0_9HYME
MCSRPPKSGTLPERASRQGSSARTRSIPAPDNASGFHGLEFSTIQPKAPFVGVQLLPSHDVYGQAGPPARANQPEHMFQLSQDQPAPTAVNWHKWNRTLFKCYDDRYVCSFWKLHATQLGWRIDPTINSFKCKRKKKEKKSKKKKIYQAAQTNIVTESFLKQKLTKLRNFRKKKKNILISRIIKSS